MAREESTHKILHFFLFPLLPELGKITPLHETFKGAVEVVYTYPGRTKDKDLIQYMESEQITFGKNGTATVTMPLVAVDPVTRTSDGGYLTLVILGS